MFIDQTFYFLHEFVKSRFKPKRPDSLPSYLLKALRRSYAFPKATFTRSRIVDPGAILGIVFLPRCSVAQQFLTKKRPVISGAS